MHSSSEITEAREVRSSTRAVLKEQGTDSGAAVSMFQIFCGDGS